MKKIIAWFGLLLLGLNLQAQSISGGEYFFDTAPALGVGTAFSFTPADSVTQTLNVSVASLSAGFHNMFVRVKNTAGIWSHYEGRLFYVIPPVLPASPQPAVASGEWFVDADPGLGNGTAISFTQADTVNKVININVSSFSTGFHNLFIRVKNTAGIWSHYEGRLFYVIPPVTNMPQPALVSGEWFVDTDPGLGNGTAITFAQADTVNPIINVPTSALSAGTHHLFIRVKNLNGKWSHYEGRTFTVCATLLATPSITGNPVLCAGSTLNLNASSISGAISYSWTGPNGFTANTQNISINNVTGLMNGVYSVKAIRGAAVCDTSNAGTINVTVTVTDNINPTITAPANVNVVATSCTASSVSLGTPVTADNCSVANVSSNAPAVFPIGTTVVTWTVTDGSGNTASATHTVTVTSSDVINPTITAPADVSIGTNTLCEATSVNLGSPSTADNCSVVNVSNNAPSTFPIGNTTVIWTVTDGSGNTATTTQIVMVADNTNPTITAPTNVNAVATSCTASSVSLGTPVTADNCSVASITNNAPSSFPIGTTTVTWTVTDGSGNTATATQIVTVTGSDVINPTIIAPANVNVGTNTLCEAISVNLGSPSTADNCSVANVSNNAPSSFPIGNTTVTWTVTDGSGNTATATQIVTVVDNTNPTIAAPANVSVCNGSAIVLGIPSTADNCTVVNVNNNAPSIFPIGNTTITWTVTDGNGNTATATQTVTVNAMPNIGTTVMGATITATQPGATYMWADCNNNYALLSGTGVSYTPSVNGSYAVIVNLSSCIDTSACVPIVSLSVQDITNENQGIHVFPNPATDILIIESTSIAITTIILRDLSGKLLVKDIVSSSKTQLDISQLSKGVYLVECVTENGSHIERIVVQ